MTQTDFAFGFSGSRLLLRVEAEGMRVPHAGDLEELLGTGAVRDAEVQVPLRDASGGTCRTFDLPDDLEIPEGFTLVGLRAAHALIPEPLFRAAGTARQKVDWLRTHRFCSRCATPLSRHDGHEALVCPACDLLHFPKLAPAVIVLVERGREALLGRSPHFTAGVYSTLAGFVEPGESLEECVHREIREEVGIEVGNIRYFGSQPHPFPHSLMIGFIADWVDGELDPDPDEIEDAGWFTPESLPGLPHPMSIARRLVEDFVARHGA